MSSPFQRAFSSKSPLKETNYRDPEIKDLPLDERSGNKYDKKSAKKGADIGRFLERSLTPNRETTTEFLQQPKPESKKPSIRDVAAGPIRPLFPLQKVWKKAKEIYHAVDTPEERTAIKSKIKEAWKNIKGPRSTKVGN